MSEKVINELRRFADCRSTWQRNINTRKDAIDEVLVEIKAAIQRLDREEKETLRMEAEG